MAADRRPSRDFVPHPREDFTDEEAPSHHLEFHPGEKVMFKAPGGTQTLAGKIIRVAHHCSQHGSKDSPRGHDRVCLEEHEDDGSIGVPYYIVHSDALNKDAGFYAHELKRLTAGGLEAAGLPASLANDSFGGGGILPSAAAVAAAAGEGGDANRKASVAGGDSFKKPPGSGERKGSVAAANAKK